MGSEKKIISEIADDASEAARTVANDAGAAAAKVRNDAGHAADQLRSDAGAVAEKAKRDLGSMQGEAQHQVGSIIDEAKAGIGTVAREARGVADDQKNLIADQIGGVAAALDKVAGELDGQSPHVAGYVRVAAEKARGLTDGMRDSSVDEIISRAEDFGRKQPLLFIGSAALAGFAASRFLRASANRSRPYQG